MAFEETRRQIEGVEVSADNWTWCPKCALTHKDARQEAINKARNAYGELPAEEYESRLRMAESITKTDLGETLREDYELGTGKDASFYVIYKCSCDMCGFSYKFKHEEKLKL